HKETPRGVFTERLVLCKLRTLLLANHAVVATLLNNKAAEVRRKGVRRKQALIEQKIKEAPGRSVLILVVLLFVLLVFSLGRDVIAERPQRLKEVLCDLGDEALLLCAYILHRTSNLVRKPPSDFITHSAALSENRCIHPALKSSKSEIASWH